MVGADRAQTAESDRGWDRADSASDQPSSGQGSGPAIANNQVIQQADINQFEGCFQAAGDAFVGLAGLGDTTWVIVREYDSRRIDSESLLHHLPWIYAGTVDRATKHFVEPQNPVAVIKVKTTKKLVSEVAHLRLQEGLGI